MKKERYRLQVLLDLREKNKKQAEIKLAKAILKLQEEEEKLKRLKKEKEELKERKRKSIAEMSDKLSSGESLIRESSVHLNFIRKIEEDIEKKEQEITDQIETIARAKEKVKQARRDYIDACRSLQIMEKHKDLWKRKLLKRLSMAEEKKLNELGNVIHQMRKG